MMKHRQINRNHGMQARVKTPCRGRGYVELEVIGSVNNNNLPDFEKALKRFETQPGNKHYLNLGKTGMLCGRAMEDLVELQRNFKTSGRLFDVTDISAETESHLREIAMFDTFRPSMVGVFNLFHVEAGAPGRGHSWMVLKNE